MARDPKFVFEYLRQVESLANEVLSDRRDIIELNKKRDKAREASRFVKRKINHQYKVKFFQFFTNKHK